MEYLSKETSKSKVDYRWTFVIFLSLVFFSHGFHVLGWGMLVKPRWYFLLATASFLVIAFILIKWRYQKPTFWGYSKYLALWPLITCIISQFNGGSFVESFGMLTFSWTSAIAFYFLFHYYKVDERSIVYGLILFGLATCFIQIFEQLYPEYAIFGVRDITDENYTGEIAGKRNDLFKMTIGCFMVQLFCFFYFWDKLIKKITFNNILFVSLFIVSIYLVLMRQLLIATALTCVLSFFLTKGGNTKIVAIIVITVLTFLLLKYWDTLFGELISDYNEDRYTTDIRFEFIRWICDYFFHNPIEFVVGQGENPLVESWAYQKSYFCSDIGFLGTIVYFGISWVIMYFVFVYRVFMKYTVAIPNYIKLFIISNLVMTLFVFSYVNATEMTVWACMLYIASLHTDGQTDLIE